MKANTKIKYPKQQRYLPAGIGSRTVEYFLAQHGMNKRIIIKTVIKTPITKKLFSLFLKGRDYFIYKNIRQKGVCCLSQITQETVEETKEKIAEEKEGLFEYRSFLKSIQSCRGIRYEDKLPVRGQRTKTNAKTRSKRTPKKQKKKL